MPLFKSETMISDHEREIEFWIKERHRPIHGYIKGRHNNYVTVELRDGQTRRIKKSSNPIHADRAKRRSTGLYRAGNTHT